MATVLWKTSPAELGWTALCKTLRLDPAVARRVWRHGIARQVNGEAGAVRYAFAQMMAAPEAKRREAIRHFLTGHTPQQLIALLENAVAAGWLSRADVSTVQEALLQQTRADGFWGPGWGVYRKETL